MPQQNASVLNDGGGEVVVVVCWLLNASVLQDAGGEMLVSA